MPTKGRKGQIAIKKPTGFLNSVMQEDQKGCKDNNVRGEEEKTTAARTKQHEDKEKYSRISPWGRGEWRNKGKSGKKRTKQAR